MNSERNVRYAKCSISANKNPIANILSSSDCVSYFVGFRCLNSLFFANRQKRKITVIVWLTVICLILPFGLAEREGFEPPEPRSSTVFKTAAIDHSAISPMHLKHCAFLQKRCKCICFFCYYKQFHQLLFLFFITSYLSISILLINTRIHTRWKDYES